MIRSMMSHISLAISFWEYVLEHTTKFIHPILLNVSKTLLEIWNGSNHVCHICEYGFVRIMYAVKPRTHFNPY